MSGLTHFDAKGDAHMVDVSDKDVTSRTATARGAVTMVGNSNPVAICTDWSGGSPANVGEAVTAAEAAVRCPCAEHVEAAEETYADLEEEFEEWDGETRLCHGVRRATRWTDYWNQKDRSFEELRDELALPR